MNDTKYPQNTHHERWTDVLLDQWHFLAKCDYILIDCTQSHAFTTSHKWNDILRALVHLERDLIAATGLVNLLKLDSNCQFFSLCDLEILMDDLKNYRVPLLHYIKLCVSSQTLHEFKLELLSRNAQFGSKSVIFCPVWHWNLTDDLEKQ